MTSPKPPSIAALKSTLGDSCSLWIRLVERVTGAFPNIREEWKAAKVVMGQVCLLKQKEKTLVYLIPIESGFEVSVVLGEQAAAAALAEELRDDVRQVILSARKYAEGRSIRFQVTSEGHLPDIQKLIEAKIAKKTR